MAAIRWVHLCDHAFYDQFGKPCLIGIFNAIAVPRVPTVRAHAALALEMGGEPNELANMRIQVVRPDASDPLIDINPQIPLGSNGVAHTVLALDNLQLPDIGRYEVRVYINNVRQKELLFNVVRTPEAERTAGRG